MKIKLVYLKDSKKMMGLASWNLIEPRLPEYDYKYGFPTFSVDGLRQHGIIK